MFSLLFSNTNTQIQNNGSNNKYNHIAEYIDSFVHHGHIIIIFELLSLDLYHVISKRNHYGLPIEIVSSVTRQILSGLNELHNCNIIHGDIKPENILLFDETSLKVKISDFGSSRLANQEYSTYIVSRYYRAPEIVLKLPHGFPIDIWATACVAFELFIGIPLFPGQSSGHLLEYISKFIGPFPSDFVAQSQFKNEYFNPDGTVKASERNGFSDYFTKDTLENIILDYELRFGRTKEEKAREKAKRLVFASFLKLLLQIDPSKRPSSQEALQHPFVNDNNL